jgi:hypothetical protein
MVKKKLGKYKLKVRKATRDDFVPAAYLYLPNFPPNGIKQWDKLKKSLRLVDLIGRYKGPDIIFDFDESGELVGIEIV